VPRVLLTSFEPFGGHDVNSSQEVGRMLSQAPPPGVAIDWLVLPVVAGACVERARGRVEATRPDLVLALGQAGSSPHVRLEDRAVNFDHFHFADNGGNLHLARPVLPGGPAVHRTRVAIADVLERVRSAGLEAEHSFSAGSYVCNHLYYQLLHHATQTNPIPDVLFVHLPLFPAQLELQPRAFALPLDEQVECVRQVLLAWLNPTRCGPGD
jgi:pyroglutamyl-peptidase